MGPTFIWYIIIFSSPPNRRSLTIKIPLFHFPLLQLLNLKLRNCSPMGLLTFIRILCLKIEMVRLAYFKALRPLNQFKEDVIAFTLYNQIENLMVVYHI